MRITWAGHNEVMPYADAFGYTSASVNLRDAVARAGVEITDDARVAIHLCHPYNFRPELYPHHLNVLFTMYEFDPPPSEFPAAFSVADAIFVPSRYCAKIFERPARGKPIFVSKLGYDPTFFRYTSRRWIPREGRPFTFLWAGALNKRKGYDIIVDAWEPLKHQPWLKLVMKTTTAAPEDQQRHFTVWNMEYDERRVSRTVLSFMYANAHAFVYPTRGEGFGLTALEALATGLPIVTIRHSGILDFLDPSWCMFATSHPQQVDTPFGQPWGRKVDANILGPAMLDVVRDYGTWVNRARKGAAYVARNFTWDHAATALIENVKRLAA
jgi:glycosyltransferase involved in cell wall biosynthesis